VKAIDFWPLAIGCGFFWEALFAKSQQPHPLRIYAIRKNILQQSGDFSRFLKGKIFA
jgi:hypothetical protein